MGLDDQPGELDGYGPITAAMARRIASDPTANGGGCSPTTTAWSCTPGSKTYRPPAGHDPHRHRPRRPLRVPRLPQTSPPQRPRPHPGLQTRRPDHPSEPDVALPTPPPPQTRRHLDRPPRRRHRHHHLDRPPRPAIPNPTTTTNPPRLPHQRTAAHEDAATGIDTSRRLALETDFRCRSGPRATAAALFDVRRPEPTDRGSDSSVGCEWAERRAGYHAWPMVDRRGQRRA